MVGKIAAQVEDITASMQRGSASSQEVVTAVCKIDVIRKDTASQVQTISAATQEQSNSVEEIAFFVQTLSQMAQGMRGMIEKSKF